MKFQADVKEYVDMIISSTINLPAWARDLNNEDTIEPFHKCWLSMPTGCVGSFAMRMAVEVAQWLRGFTCYIDSSRGEQPLTAVPYGKA